MVTDLLTWGPETPGEELRLERVQQAMRIYERAKRLRMVAVVGTLALSIARVAWPLLFPPAGNPPSAPVLLGICLFASFFAIALERSTRMSCHVALQEYEAFLRARGRTD